MASSLQEVNQTSNFTYSKQPRYSLKMIFSNFWTKLTQKGYFQSKKGKKITIEFYIFEIL